MRKLGKKATRFSLPHWSRSKPTPHATTYEILPDGTITQEIAHSDTYLIRHR